ncbi:hypothetical protein T03_10777 [Trichinella britovi]|uniref:Uncharacterized protein n=1 Tax=Trichinella britovi TaxID=45882 RepID=A0A0V1D4K2_TRIBR|nr:hypothetical protein T03_10777 [Trichinella britovi]
MKHAVSMQDYKKMNKKTKENGLAKSEKYYTKLYSLDNYFPITIKLRRVFVSAALCPGVHQNFGFFRQNIPGRQQESTGVYVEMTSAANMLSGCSKIPCCMKETTPHASTGSMANKTLQAVKEAFLL